MGRVKLDAIMFDVDGTLTDTAPRQHAWFQEWVHLKNERDGTDYKFPFKDFNEWLEAYNDDLHSCPADMFGDGIQRHYDRLGPKADVKGDKTKSEVWIEYNRYKAEHPSGLIDGVKEMIEDIFMIGSLDSDPSVPTRLRMGINTTNSYIPSVHYDLKKAKILQYFDTQIGAEMLELYHGAANGHAIKKPSKLSVEMCLGRLGTRGERTIHVGDTLNDLSASKGIVRNMYSPHDKEDIITVGALWGYEPKEKLMEGVILADGTHVHFDHLASEPQEIVWLVKKYRGVK